MTPNDAYFARIKARRRSPVKRVQKWIDRQLWALVGLIYAPFARRLQSRGVRFLKISNPDRIGHLAAEIDWYLKKVALGDLPEIHAILLVRRGRAANRALLDLWATKIEVVQSGLRYRLLRPFLNFPDLVIDTGVGIVALSGPAEYAQVLTRWQPRPPVLALPDEMAAHGRAVLTRLGMPEDAWFVCLHAREGSYSPKDEYVHHHRNADIRTYRAAAEAIAARGGWIVRMGDAGMRPLEGWPNTVDYAVSAEKSPEMDIFLCAAARFFLGNTSGLCVVSLIFGVPSVLVNMIPYAASMGMGPDDIAIPKRLCRGERMLSFAEILGSEVGHYRAAELYSEAKLEIVDNTESEIRAVTVQMLDRLDNSLAPPDAADRRRQARWRALMSPDHYCYHSAGEIGRAFLRDHATLME